MSGLSYPVEQLDAAGTPYPDYVISEAERARWDVCTKIVAKLAEVYEADNAFRWYTVRSIYQSDIPTGPLEEEALVEAGTQDLLAELERAKPGPGASEEEAWAHVGRVCDILDELFGNPDDLDFGEYEGAKPAPGEGHPTEVVRSVVEGLAVPYTASLHPRDRMGKWQEKLNGMREVVSQHREQVRRRVAVHLAARRLGKEIKRAEKRGGALHADPSKLTRKADASERARAEATEQRHREAMSVRTRRLAHKTKVIAAGTALSTMAHLYSETTAQRRPAVHELGRDAQAVVDRMDQANTVKDVSHEIGRWAVEHHDEIRTVMHAVGHVARVAVGAAEVTDDDEADAELVLAESFAPLEAT